MVAVSIEIKSIQGINSLDCRFELKEGSLQCVVGKNGVGKTTLIKAIKTISRSDTFKSTSPESIFSEGSSIKYNIFGQEHEYIYDPSILSLECKNPPSVEICEKFDVELPIPYGQRFNFFQNIGAIDKEIRKCIILGGQTPATNLISFLSDIYGTNKFSQLVEVLVGGVAYYCIVNANGSYIREDYMSSGEYFIISLYRKLISKTKIIVIDEIDISLDAAAQVKLVKWLRDFCLENGVCVLFTTHSLALMKTLKDGELFYMEDTNGKVTIQEVPYSYVKSVLFGFRGYDKYILTEDIVLNRFINYLISREKILPYYKHIVIHIGGASNIGDLVKRNANYEFFSAPENVFTVYDGDQVNEPHAKVARACCIPIKNIEDYFYDEYKAVGSILPRLKNPLYNNAKAKALYKEYCKSMMQEEQIFDYIYTKCKDDFVGFIQTLNGILKKTEQEVFVA